MMENNEVDDENPFLHSNFIVNFSLIQTISYANKIPGKKWCYDIKKSLREFKLWWKLEKYMNEFNQKKFRDE